MKEIHIGDVILSKRKEKGITQDVLANYIGVSKTAVSKWETSQSYPDVTFLPLLASYFDISIDELMGYEPMLSKEDIKIYYKNICNAFLEQPIDDVIDELKRKTHKYQTCHTLLFHIALLYINHLNLAKDEDQMHVMCHLALENIQLVHACSDDINERKTARDLEAFCHLNLKQPEKALLLFDGIEFICSNYMLANAYVLNEDFELAQEALHVDIFQALSIIVNNLQLLITIENDDEKLADIIQRMYALMDIFQFSQIDYGAVLGLDLAIINAYAKKQNKEMTFRYLDRYIIHLSQPKTFELKPLANFEVALEWIKKQEFYVDLPRDEKVIRKSCYQAITENPVFEWLKDDITFQNICERLKIYCL